MPNLYEHRFSSKIPFTWIDLDYTSPDAYDELLRRIQDTSIVDSIVREDTRPRFHRLKEGFLLFLRGINLNDGDTPEDMVSLRIYTNPETIITAHRRSLASIHLLQTAEDIEQYSTKDFVIRLLEEVNERISSYLDNISLHIEQIENDVREDIDNRQKHALAVYRKNLHQIKRYILSQREAIEHLFRYWKESLSSEQDLAIQDNIDHLTYMIEENTLLAERVLISENLFANRLIEKQNIRIYLLSIISGIFLPLTFITGLFGMNTTDMPFSEGEWGFLKIILLISFVGVVSAFALRLKKWL